MSLRLPTLLSSLVLIVLQTSKSRYDNVYIIYIFPHISHMMLFLILVSLTLMLYNFLFIHLFTYHPCVGSHPVKLFIFSFIFYLIVHPLSYAWLFTYSLQTDMSIVVRSQPPSRHTKPSDYVTLNFELRGLYSFLTCVCRYS